MKIAIINQHPHDSLGGSEIQSDIIATHLTRFGHQVVYLAVMGSKTAYDVPYTVIPMGDLNPFHLYRILKDIHPDIIYWRFDKNALFTSALISRLAKCKFVFSITSNGNVKVWVGGSQLIFAKPGWYKEVTLRHIVRDILYLYPIRGAINYSAIQLFADGVVSMNKDYLGKILVKKKKTIYDSEPTEAVDFSWPKPYLIWVANLKKIKNPELYVQLAETLLDTDVDFLMVGKIQHQEYEYIASSNMGPSNFHYLGPKTLFEVNGIIKNALFLVHTCDVEGFPNNFIQAWQQGKPTISLYYDPEGIIEREKLGYFSRTFPKLVEDTRHLIENEPDRLRLGQKAREFANENFDSEKNVRQLEAFLVKVMED